MDVSLAPDERVQVDLVEPNGTIADPEIRAALLVAIEALADAARRKAVEEPRLIRE